VNPFTLCPICGQPATEPKFRPFCSPVCSDHDLARVREELIAGLETLATMLLGGPPSIKTSRTWRWGNRGSFLLEIGGRKRGTWHDKESEQGGPMLKAAFALRDTEHPVGAAHARARAHQDQPWMWRRPGCRAAVADRRRPAAHGHGSPFGLPHFEHSRKCGSPNPSP
jgi:hypothetical protein